MIGHEAVGVLRKLTGGHPEWFFQESWWWMAFGLIGNCLFGSRFFVQWFLSERHKRLVVPPIFWHLSFWGSIVNLIYAFHVDKVPVILGFLFLPILYARNLILLRRNPAALGAGENPASPSGK